MNEEFIEIFRLVSGQIIVAELEGPIEEEIKKESFVAINPIIVYYEREHELLFEDMDSAQTGMSTYIMDYLSDFGTNETVFKTKHIMTYGKISSLMKQLYLNYLPSLIEDREFRENLYQEFDNKEHEPYEANRELYEEILKSFEQDDDQKPN